MADFIHSILAPNAAVAADGDEILDLPVNPLTMLLIHISPLNNTGTITTYAMLVGLLSAIDNVRVTHKGAAVIDARGDDLAALALLWHGFAISQSNAVETNNDRRSLVLPIFFGRTPYSQTEAFPATKRGELQLTITWDIADSGFDGLRRSIETIELPGATPEFVQKVTTLAQTFAATGQNDIDLPIGNVLRGALLFGTTPFAGATPAPSLGQLNFMVNNLQRGFAATDFEVLRGLHGLSGLPYPPDFTHIHSVNAAGAGQEDTQQPEIGASLDDNYALMTLDVTKDDEYSINTEGASSVKIRATAETADAVRVLPIERVAATRFTE